MSESPTTAAVEATPSPDQATAEDIYYCYRLLLMREPSPEDIEYWKERVKAEQLTYGRLAAYFRKSREYVIGRKARGITLLTLDDFELYVQEHDWDIGENLIETKLYEPHVTSFLKEHLQEGMTFVDVGANVGFFTLTAATKVGKSGKVVAVECNPLNVELIYMSLHRNGFDHVTVYPFAVGDAQKLMSFSWGFSNGFVDELAKDDDEAFIVQAVTLDSLLKNETRVDVIKMDIEGSEAKAWQGMQETIAKHHPVFLMEFFPALLERVSGVKGDEFLNDVFACGYSAGVLRREQEMVTTQSTSEVIAEWEKDRELVGDVAKTYLDLVFLPNGQ
ncbi:MAG TPA: FkbM family methyltransferase [Pyrinomonadaceae bacterium]|nr:FkbM family methyltransferase [Pyrinomonadaceae bacterium]